MSWRSAPRTLVLPAGVTKLQTTGTDTTGSTKWTMCYIPIDNGAAVA
jgi:hypothetical protein